MALLPLPMTQTLRPWMIDRSDLFGEQAVLCGGTQELVKAGFDIMVRGWLCTRDGLFRGAA